MNTLGLPHTVFTDADYTTERSHSGDLYQMLYPKGTQKEETQVYQTSFSYVNQPRSDEDILMQTTQENAPNGRLLLCRDSFGNALHSVSREDFRKAIISRRCRIHGAGAGGRIRSSSRSLSDICRIY